MRAYYNEFDPGAAEWLRELIKAGLIAPGVVDERSILDVRADELVGFTQCHFFAGIGGWSYALRLAGWPDDRPVWTGSPPCQPFSVAGAGKGRDDERHLAPHFIGLVGAARPGVLFGEQVASSDVFGKVAKRTRNQAESAPAWAWFDDLQNRLEAAHYATGASDIPAASIGAPHIRQRTFFGAYDLRSAAGGMADADSAKPEQPARQGAMPDQAPGARSHCQPDGSSDASGLADAASSRPLPGAQPGIYRGEEGAGTRHGELERLDAVGRVANTRSGRSTPRLSEPQQRQERFAREHDDSCGEFTRLEGTFAVSRTDAAHSIWANPDWLFCRDGKWRPVEPGSFPLADGVPGRVGLLRGYGNAICPQAAKEFIEAFREVMPA